MMMEYMYNNHVCKCLSCFLVIIIAGFYLQPSQCVSCKKDYTLKLIDFGLC